MHIPYIYFKVAFFELSVEIIWSKAEVTSRSVSEPSQTSKMELSGKNT